MITIRQPIPRQSLLRFSDSPATLVKTSVLGDELSVTYEFEFDVSLALALSQGLQTVSLQLSLPNSAQPSALSKQVAADLVNTVRFRALQLEASSTLAQQNIFADQLVDLTVLLNNEMTSKLNSYDHAGIQKSQKSVIIQSVRSINNAAGNLAPLVQARTMATKTIASNQAATVNGYNLLTVGTDPASVVSLSLLSSANELRQGESSHGNEFQQLISDRRGAALLMQRRVLLNANMNDLSAGTQKLPLDSLVPVLGTSSDAWITCRKRIHFNPRLIGANFTVKISLLDANGNTRQAQSINVNHPQQVDVLNKPRISPSINLQLNENQMGTVYVRIRQRDRHATIVRLLKKEISRINSLASNAYKFIADVDVKYADGDRIVAINISSSRCVILRAIAIGPGDDMGGNFSSIVLPPRRSSHGTAFSRVKNGSLIPEIVDSGIQLRIAEIPPDVHAIKIMRRDLSLKETDFADASMGSAMFLHAGTTAFPATFIDRNVRSRHNYQYALSASDRFGNEYFIANQPIIKYIPKTNSIISLQLLNQRLLNDAVGYDFVFDIHATLLPKTQQVAKDLLQQQDLLQFFLDEVNANKGSLNQLIAYGIVRNDLTNGAIEDLGTITSETFSDRTVSQLMGAHPLVSGHRYRYDIRPQLRAGETLLSSKVTVTGSNGLTYSYQPSKYFNPLVAATGDLTDESTRAQNHAGDELSFGDIGSLFSIETNIPSMPHGVSEFFFERHGSSLFFRWRINGSRDAFDHFILMRDTIAGRSFVGAAHNVARNGVCEFFHELNEHDLGRIRYVLIPIFADYAIGAEVHTTDLIIS